MIRGRIIILILRCVTALVLLLEGVGSLHVGLHLLLLLEEHHVFVLELHLLSLESLLVGEEGLGS